MAKKLRNCHHKENQLVVKILYGRKKEESQITNPWGQLLTHQRHTPRVKACASCYVCPRHSHEASTPRRSHNPPEQKRQHACMTAVAMTAKWQWEPHKKHCHGKAAHRKAPERQEWKSSCLPWPAGKYFLFVADLTLAGGHNGTTWKGERVLSALISAGST